MKSKYITLAAFIMFAVLHGKRAERQEIRSAE